MSCLTAPSLPYKFSDHTTKLQNINKIRNSSVGSQLKRVIDLLRDRGQALNADEIKAACHVDLKSNRVVFDSLKNNPVVKYDGLRFSYKPKSSEVDEGAVDFQNDLKIPSIEVDGVLKTMFRDIVMPPDMVGIENELRRNGMRPSTDTAKRARLLGVRKMVETTKKKRERKITKRTKLTNPQFMKQLLQQEGKMVL